MTNLDLDDPSHRELSTSETFHPSPWTVGLLALVLVGAGLLAFSSTAAASHGDAAIVVAQDGSEDFAAIQPAIAHADAGDTIRVLPGTYEETVTIDKADLTLCSSADGTACDGTPEDTIIHALAEFSPAVSIQADGASLQGFFVNVAGDGIAIDASQASQTLVEGNEIETGIPDATFGVQAATNPADRDYWLSSFVEEMYNEGVVADVTAEYEDTEGFVSAIPAVPEDGENHIVLVYENEAPDGVTGEPATDDRPALKVYEGVDYEEPQADADTAGPDDDDTVLQAQEAPEQVPDGYEKIRPGARLSVGCTANWVWSDASGQLYLGTAGHCFLGGGEDTNFDPGVSVCVENCSRYGVGVEVQPRTWLELGQVRYAENSGQVDFAAIEIPMELYNEWVDPELAHWGGPSDAIANRSQPTPGTPYAHYGHGQGVAETFLTQPRAGVYAISNNNQVQFFPPPSFGDSGSAIATGAVDAQDDYHGDRAAGVVTHIGLINPGGVPNTGLGGGPHVDHVKDTVEAELGFSSFDVVLEDETIELPGAPQAPENVTASDESTPDELLIEVTWELPADSPPAESYDLIDADTGDVLLAGIESTSVLVDQSIDPDLAEGQERCYQVQAENAQGTSDLSEAACATAENPDHLPIPAPTVNAFDLERGDTISAVWDDPELPAPENQTIVGYNIEWVVDGEFLMQGDYRLGEDLLTPVVPEERVLQYTFAEEGSHYEFTVRAIVEDDRSDDERLSEGGTDGATVTSADATWKQAQRTEDAWASTPASTTLSVPEVPELADVGGTVTAAPLVADLTGDGSNEVLVAQDAGATDTQLDVSAYEWTDAGFTELWTTSFDVSASETEAFTQPAIGDFDGDGDDEVVLVVDYVTDAVAASGHITELHFLAGDTGERLDAQTLTINYDEPIRVVQDAADGRDLAVFATNPGATSAMATRLKGYALTGDGNVDQLFQVGVSATQLSAAPVVVDDGTHDAGPSIAVGIGDSVHLCRITLADGSADCENVATLSSTVRGLASTYFYGTATASIVAHADDTLNVVDAEQGLVSSTQLDAHAWNQPALGEAGLFAQDAQEGLHQIASAANNGFVDDIDEVGDLFTHQVDDATLQQLGHLARGGAGEDSAQVPYGPVVVDVAGDDDNEIILPDESGTITALDGDALADGDEDPVVWQTDLGAAIAAPLTLGDVTGDGDLEMLAVTEDGQLGLLEHITDTPDDQIGIDLSSTTEAAVENNGITAHGDETDSLGIVASGSGAQDAHVSSNTIDVAATGVYAGTGSTGMLVEDNEIHAEPGWCSTDDLDMDGASPHRFVCDDPDVRGVQANDAVTIRNNTITSDHVVVHTDDGEVEVTGTWGVNVLGADVAVEENAFSGWGVAGTIVWSHDASIADNTFTQNSVGVHLSSSPGDTDIEDNRFTDNGWAVRFAGGSTPSVEDVELRNNDLADNLQSLWLDNDGLRVDARLNHWGVVGEDAIELTRIQDDGEDNEVQVKPYLDGDGDPHPPLPEVRCHVDGTLETVSTPLSLQTATTAQLPAACDDGHRQVAIDGDFEAYDGATVEDALLPHTLAALPLDEAAGSTTFEDLTDDHDASCEEPRCPAAGVEGAFGTAARFDGTDDVLTVDSLAGFQAGDAFSVETWFQLEGPSSENSFPRVVSQGNSGNGDGAWSIVVQDDGSNVLFRALDEDGTTHDVWASDVSLDDGAFHQVVATYDGATAKLYVDGEQAAAESFSTPIRASQAPLEIGNANDERPFDGVVDAVTLHGVALEADAIDGETPTATGTNPVHLVGEGSSAVFAPTIEATPDQPAAELLAGSEGALVDNVTLEVASGATGVRIAADDVGVQDSSASGTGTAVDVTAAGHDARIENVEATFVGDDPSGVAAFDVSGDGSVLTNVDATGWENGVRVTSNAADEAAGVEVRDSRLAGNVKGLQDRCDTVDLTVRDNRIADNVVGVQVCQDEIELRNNTFRVNGEALRVTQATSEATVDARLNDWGVYEHELVQARASDQGDGNQIQQVPFLDADGTPEPALPIHAETGDAFLSVDAALDAAGTGDTVLLPGSDHADPNPYVEELSIQDDGVRLCASANGTCTIAPGSVELRAPATADTLVSVEANDVAIEGVRLAGDAGQTGVHVTETAERATLADDEIRSWTTGVQTDGPAAELDANAFQANDVGIRVGAEDATLIDNEHQADTIAIETTSSARNVTIDGPRAAAAQIGVAVGASTNVTVDGGVFTGTATGVSLAATAGQPSAVAVNNTRLGLTETPLFLGTDTEGVSVDATCNDWGAYHPPTIEARIEDAGTDNEVDFTPWLGPNPEATTFFGCIVEPVADLSHEPEVTTRNEAVEFTDESRPGSAPIVEWVWEFGDGDTSRLQNPSHTYGEVGTFQVNLTVRDANGVQDSTTGIVVVENLAPELGTPADIQIPHTESITFPVEAEDADGDATTLNASGEPLDRGANFTVEEQGTPAPQGEFTWEEIEPQDRGTYQVDFAATDELGAQTEDTVEVEIVDDPPAIDPVGDQSTRLEHPVSFTLEVSDANGDPVHLSAGPLPVNATFEVKDQDTEAPTGAFAWTPTDPAMVGTHEFTFSAESEGLVTQHNVTVEVGEENIPPEITVEHEGTVVADEVTAIAGEELLLNITVDDPDGTDVPGPEATESPPIDSQLTVVNADEDTYEEGFILEAEYSWTPETQAEPVEVEISADDGFGTATETFTIRVIHPPEIEALEPRVEEIDRVTEPVFVGESFRPRAAVDDVDEDLGGVTFEVGTETLDATLQDGVWEADSTVSPTAASELAYTVNATDAEGLTTLLEDTVTVEDDPGPTADVVDEVRVTDGISPVTLDASNSSHPADRPITFSWSLPAVGSGSTDGAQAEWIAPDNGVYTATITVEDHLGETDTAAATIVVEDAVLGSAAMPSHPDGQVGATERPTASVLVTDETGMPIGGAGVTYTVSHEVAGNVTEVQRSTAGDGVNSALIPLDTDTEPGANLVGGHELTIVMSTASDMAQTPDVVEDTAVIGYQVNPPAS